MESAEVRRLLVQRDALLEQDIAHKLTCGQLLRGRNLSPRPRAGGSEFQATESPRNIRGDSVLKEGSVGFYFISTILMV